MKNKTKSAVLAALSEGFSPTLKPAFEAGCLAVMDYQPSVKDQANFFKLVLPTYTRLVRADERRLGETNQVAEFVDRVEISMPVDMISVDDQARWYEGLANRYEREHPIAL